MRGLHKLGALALCAAALSQGNENTGTILGGRNPRVKTKTPLTPMQKIRLKRSNAAKQARKKNRA